jgi:hypothetical protein
VVPAEADEQSADQLSIGRWTSGEDGSGSTPLSAKPNKTYSTSGPIKTGPSSARMGRVIEFSSAGCIGTVVILRRFERLE